MNDIYKRTKLIGGVDNLGNVIPIRLLEDGSLAVSILSSSNNQTKFITKNTTVQETAIAIGTESQLEIKSFKLELLGDSENIITARNGSEGNIIDRFILNNKGDTKGFIKDTAEWIIDNNLVIECSTTQAVMIYMKFAYI